MPLIPADSMPPQPCLCNVDPRLGRLVKFYVLGFVLSSKDVEFVLSSNALIKWADDNQIAPEKTKNNRRHLT
jgi:hypothetical protein